MVFLIPIVQAFLFFGFRQIHPTLRISFSLALLLAMRIALILSQSCGAWMAYISELLLMFVLHWKRDWLMSSMILIAGVFIMYWFVSQYFLNAPTARLIGLGFEGLIEIWLKEISSH